MERPIAFKNHTSYSYYIMDAIKTMYSLPIPRKIKALVKTINLKESKIRTSPVRVTECYKRSLPLPQPIELDIIDKIKKLITCMS